MEEEYLSVKEFASLVGVHYNTIIRAIRSGRLNAFRLSSSRKAGYRIARSEIHRLAFMNLEEMVCKIIEEKIK